MVKICMYRTDMDHHMDHMDHSQHTLHDHANHEMQTIAQSFLNSGILKPQAYLFWKTYNNLQYRAVAIPDKNATTEEPQVVHDNLWRNFN
ncbi:unnamed protein product [Acanthoscelides obtectus]|uniref:Uncharacterized protein n=1 Tax=Acanthoscelides obtectus TaxID=200917 RepID=A0A9P0PNK3_ACAOB|nr:unnamed protein product [Acanthoscelides obtectus]CAK1629552.1 hypothetical protein AOBTE_LOCUS5812 [Acanthoscelides obtectus]